jgi:sigma-E factor negative regulatory protein RseB
MRVGFPAVAPWLALGAILPVLAAPPEDPVAWLQKAAVSARETTYAGTVMHVTGDRTATTRITHLFIGGAEHEKIESLDGPPREIVRHNDEMQCFYPDAKTVRMDRRVSARLFPSLLAGPPKALAENYKISLGAVERLLGKDCQWIHLDPRDALRFAQRLCAELSTGLLLRAKTLGPRQQVVEQFTFTDLRLGSQVSRGEVKSTFHAQSKDWRRDNQVVEETLPVSTGWEVAAPPPGFRLVGEMHRKMPNKTQPVSQLVLSDGIAHMSVFVEPLVNARRAAEALTEDGGLSVFIRPLGEHFITVVGDVPGAAVQQVGRSVAKLQPVAVSNK